MGSINFNQVPSEMRAPGVYTEIDNSRALKGLVANPHKVLILGERLQAAAGGVTPVETLVQITSTGLSGGFFGNGSPLDMMCKIFKENNPNTEVWAMAGSMDGGVMATGHIDFSWWMSANAITVGGPLYIMINGQPISLVCNIGDEGDDMAVRFASAVHANSTLPVICTPSTVAAPSDGVLVISAVCSGSWGNNIDIRANFYEGQVQPLDGSVTFLDLSAEAGGSFGHAVLAGGDVKVETSALWAVIDGEQFHYIIHPWAEAGAALPFTATMDSAAGEMSDRADPVEDLQGHIFTATRNNLASATLIGNSLNSPYVTVLPVDNSPMHPHQWAAALGAIGSKYLEDDPGRPLHYLRLSGLLPPPYGNRFSRYEREASLLYDGLATFIVDASGYPVIERCITTYQTTAAGFPDASYLDVQTMSTLSEIRYQVRARMMTRFLLPRFKLADDTFPVQPGSHVATPKTVKQEFIALFTFLRDKGLIENLNDFIDNLVVERDDTDVNRVNALLPADLINQFRILAAQIQFIL